MPSVRDKQVILVGIGLATLLASDFPELMAVGVPHALEKRRLRNIFTESYPTASLCTKMCVIPTLTLVIHTDLVTGFRPCA
jgi:hypothetical protein